MQEKLRCSKVLEIKSNGGVQDREKNITCGCE